MKNFNKDSEACITCRNKQISNRGEKVGRRTATVVAEKNFQTSMNRGYTRSMASHTRGVNVNTANREPLQNMVQNGRPINDAAREISASMRAHENSNTQQRLQNSMGFKSMKADKTRTN